MQTVASAYNVCTQLFQNAMNVELLWDSKVYVSTYLQIYNNDKLISIVCHVQHIKHWAHNSAAVV